MAGLLHGYSMVSNVILPCEEVIMTRKVLAVCVVLLGLTSFSAAKTINVPNENCASIQCAIDFDDPCYPSYIAVDGDEIVVGPEWADPHRFSW
jgi:hypothetical protein